MVAKRFRVADGKAAIWIGPGDMLPFVAPLSHLSRVKFHSDLDYLPIVKVLDYTVNLPSIPASGSGQGSSGTGRRGLRTFLYPLGKHGMGFTPFCVGELTMSGTPIAFVGSIPVAQTANDRYARWLSLGFDATNITAYEYSVQRGWPDVSNGWAPRPSTSVDVRVYVSAVSLDSDNEPALDNSYFHLDAMGMRMGAMGFSTDRRYIREPHNPDDAMLQFVEGPSIALRVTGSGSNQKANWRWECGNVTRAGSSSDLLEISPPSAGFTSIRKIAL
jgi:hypothetical protein